jgi:hypothetical protein
LPLTRGHERRFRSFPFPFSLSSTAPLPCKTPFLLLGIVGLAAALLEFEEGLVAPLVQQLQNICKHNFFHLEDRVRDKRDSALDQVRMIWGSELHPGNVPVFILLG